MTLEQLRMLVTIADAGGILAAADKMNKTQPTISVAMKKLEDELGLQILSRESYRVSLTPAGEALCRQARVILKQGQIFTGMAKHLAQGNEPEVSIAIEASCPYTLVLEMLAECENEFPETQFNLMGETLWGALERLQMGEADLAISPWFEENLEFEIAPITTVTLISVATPKFRDELEKHELTLDDLKNSVQVVVRDSSRKPRSRTFGFLPEGRHWFVGDHFTKKQIIMAGMGWGRLHEHLIEEELNSGKLVSLKIKNYQSTFEVDICIARMMDKPVGFVSESLWQKFSKLNESTQK
jgi:DNA-binding transcriptional LysR family regulator